MYRKIIAGYQPDERGREALALACSLAEPASANVIVATVLDTRGYWGMDHSVIDQLEHDARARIEQATASWPLNVKVSPHLLRGSSAAGALQALAEDERADLLVLGSTHMGRVGRALVGTSAEHVLYGAPCPLVLAPHGYERPRAGIRTIAAGFDGSAQSRVALVWAAGAAAAIGAELRVIGVIVADTVDSLRKDMRHMIEAAVADLPYDLAAELSIRVGDAAVELRAAAKENIDLLVVGSRGHGPIRGVFAGSVSAALARNCAAPVVVVPRTVARLGRPARDDASFTTGQHELSPEEVADMIAAERVQIVDLRDEWECQAGSVPRARHIPLAKLATEASTFDRERPIVFYSGHGDRGALAMHACRALGMTAYSLRGGIEAWVEHGMPVETLTPA